MFILTVMGGLVPLSLGVAILIILIVPLLRQVAIWGLFGVMVLAHIFMMDGIMFLILMCMGLLIWVRSMLELILL